MEKHMTKVSLFTDGRQFDNFLQQNGMGYGFGSRAKGILRSDGSIEVAIDQKYYERGGIPKDQLQAIVEHERIELLSDSPDPHLEATIGEYRYIFNHFGQRGLESLPCKIMQFNGRTK